MKRLVDEVADNQPLLWRAQELLGAMPPLVATDLQRRRVRTALASPRTRRYWQLQPSLAAALLLVAPMAIGAGLIGRSWIRHHVQPTPELLQPVPRTAPRIARPAPAHAMPLPQVAAPSPPIRMPPPVQPLRSSARPPVQRPASNPSREESVLVVQAVQALRGIHDPSRASRLLDQYLARFPRGALIEEAMALRIEAASARDPHLAAAAGREYLRRFPKGRFREAAEQAQHGSVR